MKFKEIDRNPKFVMTNEIGETVGIISTKPNGTATVITKIKKKGLIERQATEEEMEALREFLPAHITTFIKRMMESNKGF